MKLTFLWTLKKNTWETLSLLEVPTGLESFHLARAKQALGASDFGLEPFSWGISNSPRLLSSSSFCEQNSQLIVFKEPGWITIFASNHKEIAPSSLSTQFIKKKTKIWHIKTCFHFRCKTQKKETWEIRSSGYCHQVLHLYLHLIGITILSFICFFQAWKFLFCIGVWQVNNVMTVSGSLDFLR